MSELVLTEESSGTESRIESEGTIGREACDLVLADAEVSRRHAQVRLTESGYTVEDLGSSNGTYLNGRVVSEATPLSDGDRLQVGETVLLVKLPAEATRLRATPPTPEPVAAQAPQGDVRGDVPRPEDTPPSAIRRAIPKGQATLEVRSFDPAPARRRGPSAARRIEATIICYGVVLATAIAVTLYFVQR